MQKKLMIGSSCCFALFGIIAISMFFDLHWLTGIDTYFIQNRGEENPLLTLFFGSISRIATIGPMLITTSIFAYYCWRRQARIMAFWCLGNMLLIAGTGYLLKLLFQRPRPDIEQFIARYTYSFPSGHTLLMMGLFTSIAIALFSMSIHKLFVQIVPVIFLLTILIGAGRIYLGVHYFSDVLASTVLSVAISMLTYGAIYLPFQVKEQKKKKQVSWMPKE